MDENTLNLKDVTIPIVRVVNYDLNIFTYIHNLFDNEKLKYQKVPEK